MTPVMRPADRRGQAPAIVIRLGVRDAEGSRLLALARWNVDVRRDVDLIIAQGFLPPLVIDNVEDRISVDVGDEAGVGAHRPVNGRGS
eukprot:CAMPEP_0206055512 /NCGR_PEP_ID=MMETSP1466-20131121/40277_1 /ASSEMBLY_ACC=CAM_ASM_001126 /TAXON_ID=44452 /ORGANISM="Pavlova gyrans, Strain CCMP608" /LENGTH=87 /DNA_ID=CAMNT_0053430739 /DNA_START=52 /DNA_END=316 /DNA_ORIENTATION=-